MMKIKEKILFFRLNIRQYLFYYDYYSYIDLIINV